MIVGGSILLVAAVGYYFLRQRKRTRRRKPPKVPKEPTVTKPSRVSEKGKPSRRSEDAYAPAERERSEPDWDEEPEPFRVSQSMRTEVQREPQDVEMAGEEALFPALREAPSLPKADAETLADENEGGPSSTPLPAATRLTQGVEWSRRSPLFRSYRVAPIIGGPGGQAQAPMPTPEADGGSSSNEKQTPSRRPPSLPLAALPSGASEAPPTFATGGAPSLPDSVRAAKMAELSSRRNFKRTPLPGARATRQAPDLASVSAPTPHRVRLEPELLDDEEPVPSELPLVPSLDKAEASALPEVPPELDLGEDAETEEEQAKMAKLEGAAPQPEPEEPKVVVTAASALDKWRKLHSMRDTASAASRLIGARDEASKAPEAPKAAIAPPAVFLASFIKPRRNSSVPAPPALDIPDEEAEQDESISAHAPPAASEAEADEASEEESDEASGENAPPSIPGLKPVGHLPPELQALWNKVQGAHR